MYNAQYIAYKIHDTCVYINTHTYIYNIWEPWRRGNLLLSEEQISLDDHLLVK